MLRKICLILLLLVVGRVSFAQPSSSLIDLMQNTDKEKNTDKKLKLLDSLTFQIYKARFSDTDFYKKKYPKYCLEYITLAKGLDSFDLVAFKTTRLSNYYLQDFPQPDSALVILDTALKDSSLLRKKKNLALLYLKRGGVYYQTDDLQLAIDDYDRSAVLFHQSRDTIFEADAIYFSGVAKERQGKLTEALMKYQESQKLYIAEKDTAYIAFSGLAVAGMFSQLYLLDEAFKEREKIRNILNQQTQKDYSALSGLYIGDARSYRKKKMFDKEEASYLKALEGIKRGKRFLPDVFRIQAYLSEFYSVQNQIEKAKAYFDTIQKQRDLVNSPYERIFYLKAKKELLLAEEKYQEAIPIIEEEIGIFRKSKDIRGQVHLEKKLSEAFLGIKDYKNAMIHQERHLQLKDSIYNMARSNSVIYYQTLYETEKKEQEIALQKANIETLEAKSMARKRLMWFGGIGLSLLFGVLYLYRNRTLLLRNKKLQQSFLQELLQTQERVSKRISKDLHDSVGQSLLLVKNRVLQSKDEKTGAIVDGVIDEVREISRNLHPFKLEELGLTVTLQSSVDMIDENYDIFISAEIDDIDQVFDQEKEINIYRLVQESFNNILKHSNAKSAEIKVLNKANDIEIIIKDNGKGFDFHKERLETSKIGLKTLSERSKFLKANFKVLSEINKGTTLIFNIPKYA